VNNLPVPNDGTWPLSPYDAEAAARLGSGQRTYSPTNILDFATIVRIIHHWRWLVLGALGVQLVAKPRAA